VNYFISCLELSAFGLGESALKSLLPLVLLSPPFYPRPQAIKSTIKHLAPSSSFFSFSRR
jgi:hypothetical protein